MSGHRPDGFDRQQHYVDTVRKVYSKREIHTGTEFSDALCYNFRNKVIERQRRPLLRTDHPHPNDAGQRRADESWSADLIRQTLDQFPERREAIVNAIAEFQSSDRTHNRTFAGVAGQYYRASHSEKDIKYNHVCTKELQDMLCTILIDVDFNVPVTQFEDMIWKNPNGSFLIRTIRPMDATFNLSPNSETTAHWESDGTFNQFTNPAQYAQRGDSSLYRWDRDNVTVETVLHSKTGGYTKTVIQLLSVTNRQIDNRRAFVLLTPVGRRHLYTKTIHGKAHAIVDTKLIDRLEKNSTSIDGARNWIVQGREETNHGLARRLYLYVKRRQNGAAALVSEAYHLARSVADCGRTKRALRFLPIDPYPVLCQRGQDGSVCAKLEKFNPVVTHTNENGSMSFAVFRVIATGAKDGGKHNTREDYIAIARAGPGESYRVPIGTWGRLTVRRNSAPGGWTARAPIMEILRQDKVYPDESDPNTKRKIAGLTDLMFMYFKYQGAAMTHENLCVSFHNETSGRVQLLSTDHVIKEPTVVITTNGSIDSRRVSTQPTQAAMAHAHEERQKKPQDETVKAQPKLIAKYRALAHRWARAHCEEHGPLQLATLDEALDGIPSAKRDAYRESLKDDLLEKLTAYENGKHHSVFLKAETNEAGKPGRPITTIDRRLQIEMKRCVKSVYDSISKLQWYGMSKPTEIASRMVDAFMDMEFGFKGDGSKFEARYSEWTHEVFMEVIQILFGENWDEYQRRIYMAVVHSPCAFRSKEETESHIGLFDENWVMPSGVVWTTIVNTLTNFFILATSLEEAGYEPFQYITDHCRVGGDDQAGASKTLEEACHIGSCLTRTADGLGHKWVTDIWHHFSDCTPEDEITRLWDKYEGLGEISTNLGFLSRLWNDVTNGDANSVADPSRLFANISQKEASKSTGVGDAERTHDFASKVISYSPSDHFSFNDFTPLINKCFEALKIPNTKEARAKAAKEACFMQGGGAQYYITRDETGYPNRSNVAWADDAFREALAHADVDPDILKAIQIKPGEATIMPVLLPGNVDVDNHITARGCRIELVHTPVSEPQHKTGETKQRAAKPRRNRTRRKSTKGGARSPPSVVASSQDASRQNNTALENDQL